MVRVRVRLQLRQQRRRRPSPLSRSRATTHMVARLARQFLQAASHHETRIQSSQAIDTSSTARPFASTFAAHQAQLYIRAPAGDPTSSLIRHTSSCGRRPALHPVSSHIKRRETRTLPLSFVVYRLPTHSLMAGLSQARLRALFYHTCNLSQSSQASARFVIETFYS